MASAALLYTVATLRLRGSILRARCVRGKAYATVPLGGRPRCARGKAAATAPFEGEPRNTLLGLRTEVFAIASSAGEANSCGVFLKLEAVPLSLDAEAMAPQVSWIVASVLRGSRKSTCSTVPAVAKILPGGGMGAAVRSGAEADRCRLAGLLQLWVARRGRLRLRLLLGGFLRGAAGKGRRAAAEVDRWHRLPRRVGVRGVRLKLELLDKKLLELRLR